MQKGILYNRSTTLPNIRGHFDRPRIDKLLNDMLDRHLIVITAGAGSGKTRAVSAFLHNANARVFWIQLSELDNNITRFWEAFVHITGSQNKDTALCLDRLGFPETIVKYNKFLHILAKDVYSGAQVVIVFDDFHLIYDESILRFVQSLINAKLENFCIIINSRTSLRYNLTSMLANGFVGLITAQELYFTTNETEAYLNRQGVVLSAGMIEKVQTLTEGWPLAIYLIGLSIKKGGIVSKDPLTGAIPLIFEMIENDLFSEYTPQTQNLLIRISLLNFYPEDLVRTLAGDQSEVVSELIENNMFIYSNPYTEYLNIHNMFIEFLIRKQKNLTQQETIETYLKAAEWCAANDMKIEAMAYYDKCGHYEEILNIMFNFGAAIFSKTIAEFYIGLIDRFPAGIMKNNPLLHFHRAGLLYNNAEVQLAVEELVSTRRELESLPLTETNKAALGEICCMLGLISLGMADYNFVDLFKKAAEYLPNGSMILNSDGRVVNTRYSIMLNNPSPGELEKMEKAMFSAMPYASGTMNGYGEGLADLASAEASYFTGDMKKAAKNAYEAVYKAREKRVYDVASSGYFLLMRINAANGNYDGVASNLEQMKAHAESAENKWNFNGMPDVADGWFNLLFDDTDKIADWLVDDVLADNTLAPYSMGMERSIRARYLLKHGKYYELLAWLGQTEKPIRQYSIWLILLDILICKSIALHHIGDGDGSLAALCEAYEITCGNNLIMQFVELGNDIRAVIYNAKNNERHSIPANWLNEIYNKAATYEKHLRNMRVQHRQVSGQVIKPSVKITKREKEMIAYLCQGLTNAEIAGACFISVSAVKKALNNIYIKLGATNRADAVRTAIHMDLN